MAPGGCYFLFSDGLGNFGQSEPPVLDAPLYVFSADQAVDQPFLQYLALRSGGAYFPLQRLTDPQVLAAMTDHRSASSARNPRRRWWRTFIRGSPKRFTAVSAWPAN